jgi:hypothetical protein
MVWNPVSQRVVMFGGSTPADSSKRRTYMNDTWEWNTNRWVKFDAENPPSGRAGHAMVWDSEQSRILVFGGLKGFDSEGKGLLLDDTWALTGDKWTELNPATKPQPRQSHAFAFDKERGRFIIYGGYDVDTKTLTDTWEFDGVTWTKVAQDSPVLINPLMVYDEARRETLLLGTTNVDVVADRKTEMYKRTATGWAKIDLAEDKKPKCTSFGAMIFEQLYTRVVFQGGGCQTSSPVNETWVWHGTEWSQLQPRNTPGFATGFGMANEPTREQSVLFGGIDFEERSLTYRFQGNNWTPLTDVWSPGGRSLFGFQTDTTTGRIILMGGIDDQRSTYNDMWSFRSGVWQRMIPNPYPDGCYNPITTWDSDRSKLVEICDNGDVAEWDTQKWTLFTDLKTKPGNGRFRNVVYDQKLKKTVMFGGFDEINYLRETWTWDGAAWTKLSKDAAAPKARCLTAMFFDPVSQRTIVFGGIGRPTTDDAVTRYGDMWSFEGTKWVEIKPTKLPSIRYGPAVGYSPETKTIVMFGGKDASEVYLNEHWEWDGSNWAQKTPTTLPSPRMNGAMAMDPTSGKLTMYGGWSGFYQEEAWTWSGGKWEIVPIVTERQRPTRAEGTAAPTAGAAASENEAGDGGIEN